MRWSSRASAGFWVCRVKAAARTKQWREKKKADPTWLERERERQRNDKRAKYHEDQIHRIEHNLKCERNARRRRNRARREQLASELGGLTTG
jgi:hypothetical protein